MANRGLGRNAQIQDLVAQLKKKNDQLERMVARVGTAQDTRGEQRDKLAAIRAEAKQLCQQIIVSIKENRGDRDLLKRMSKDFQVQLERFTNLNQEVERKEQAVVNTMSASMRQGSPLDHQQLTDDEQLIDKQFQAYDLGEIKARSEAIRQIEKDMVELHDMFQDLKVLVDEQQEHLDTIENNVTSARDDAVEANKELRAAEGYQMSSRKKQCCVVGIILTIIGVIVIIVVILKK